MLLCYLAFIYKSTYTSFVFYYFVLFIGLHEIAWGRTDGNIVNQWKQIFTPRGLSADASTLNPKRFEAITHPNADLPSCPCYTIYSLHGNSATVHVKARAEVRVFELDTALKKNLPFVMSLVSHSACSPLSPVLELMFSEDMTQGVVAEGVSPLLPSPTTPTQNQLQHLGSNSSPTATTTTSPIVPLLDFKNASSLNGGVNDRESGSEGINVKFQTDNTNSISTKDFSLMSSNAPQIPSLNLSKSKINQVDENTKGNSSLAKTACSAPFNLNLSSLTKPAPSLNPKTVPGLSLGSFLPAAASVSPPQPRSTSGGFVNNSRAAKPLMTLNLSAMQGSGMNGKSLQQNGRDGNEEMNEKVWSIEDGPPSVNDDSISESQRKRRLLQYYRQQCSAILPNKLYLGASPVAENLEVLKSHGITHVLNAAADICNNSFPTDFSYLAFYLKDSKVEDISVVFYRSLEWIADAVSAGGRVFVHCGEGVSRSVTIVIAYLMWDFRWSFERAFDFVRDIRPIANPNTGFTFQLLLLGRRLRVQDNSVRYSSSSPRAPAPLPSARLLTHTTTSSQLAVQEGEGNTSFYTAADQTNGNNNNSSNITKNKLSQGVPLKGEDDKNVNSDDESASNSLSSSSSFSDDETLDGETQSSVVNKNNRSIKSMPSEKINSAKTERGNLPPPPQQQQHDIHNLPKLNSLHLLQQISSPSSILPSENSPCLNNTNSSQLPHSSRQTNNNNNIGSSPPLTSSRSVSNLVVNPPKLCRVFPHNKRDPWLCIAPVGLMLSPRTRIALDPRFVYCLISESMILAWIGSECPQACVNSSLDALRAHSRRVRRFEALDYDPLLLTCREGDESVDFLRQFILFNESRFNLGGCIPSGASSNAANKPILLGMNGKPYGNVTSSSTNSNNNNPDFDIDAAKDFLSVNVDNTYNDEFETLVLAYASDSDPVYQRLHANAKQSALMGKSKLPSSSRDGVYDFNFSSGAHTKTPNHSFHRDDNRPLNPSLPLQKSSSSSLSFQRSDVNDLDLNNNKRNMRLDQVMISGSKQENSSLYADDLDCEPVESKKKRLSMMHDDVNDSREDEIENSLIGGVKRENGFLAELYSGEDLAESLVMFDSDDLDASQIFILVEHSPLMILSSPYKMSSNDVEENNNNGQDDNEERDDVQDVSFVEEISFNVETPIEGDFTLNKVLCPVCWTRNHHENEINTCQNMDENKLNPIRIWVWLGSQTDEDIFLERTLGTQSLSDAANVRDNLGRKIVSEWIEKQMNENIVVGSVVVVRDGFEPHEFWDLFVNG